MEYKQIVRNTERYPGSPYLTMARFHGLNTNEKSISTEKDELLLIFDVSFVEEHEVVICIPQPQLLEVGFKHGFKNAGTVSCRRDCCYTFQYPKAIKVDDLIAHWTEDDFLVIREKIPTKIEKSEKSNTETSTELEKKVQETRKDTKSNKFENTSVSTKAIAEEENPDRSLSQNIVRENEDVEGSKDSGETKDGIKKDECAKPESVPRLFPQKLDKIYKPNLSVKELKSVMSDIENRMLFVKNFIDDPSFDDQSLDTKY